MIYNLGNIQRPEINQIVPVHAHGCISNNSLFLVPFRSPGNKLWDQKKIVLICTVKLINSLAMEYLHWKPMLNIGIPLSNRVSNAGIQSPT